MIVVKERRSMVQNLVRQKGEVSISELKAHFPEVSEMTLRRDLDFLDQRGHVVRVHGGVKSLECIVGLSEDTYSKRSAENMEQKNLISKKALGLFKPNTSIFLDSGTTTTALSRVMPDQPCDIFTTGVTCAVELANLEKPRVFLAGGNLNKVSLSTVGSQVTSQIGNVNFDIAFLGVTGFTPENGFTTALFDECELKKNAIKKASRVVLLMDSAKIGKVLTYTFASYEDVDVIVSDGNMDQDIIRLMNEKGIEII